MNSLFPTPGIRKVSVSLWNKCFLLAICVMFGTILHGCHIIDSNAVDLASKPLLRPIEPDIEAVQLDIVYIDRDVDDPLLSTLVWSEVDTIGTVDLETRSKMNGSGFRIGLVGLTPPRSLQRLLGLKGELTDDAGTSRHQELVGRSIHRRSGGEAEILTSNPQEELTISLPGEEKEKTLKLARCILRTEVERLQDGWVKLHITPEIHHGSMRMRPVAGTEKWGLKGQQEIISLRDLKFDVTLNVGEMLIISSDSLAPEKLANQFFVNDNLQRPQRRMVVIRLTDMKKLKPLYQEK